MGTMASTLAHEINQQLTAIANYLETIREMIGDGQAGLLDEMAEALEMAAAQSLRAGTIVAGCVRSSTAVTPATASSAWMHSSKRLLASACSSPMKRA
jgi:C4-dicarboxylate-specific signal transduction histidine kinase